MDSTDMKYKDELPIKTINRIRDILGEMGLLTVETSWKNSVNGFYSVSVQIDNTDLLTNGKGTSVEFALASAYGEMMERLQNLCNYRLSLDLKPQIMDYLGFYYAPDEKPMSIDEFLASEEDWIKTQLSKVNPLLDKRELLANWLTMSYEKVSADFITLPYCNLNSKRISHIPVKMVSMMYMSNGMCAGNSPEEALVQGISEIMERYANKKILRERIVPPTIPRRYIMKFPEIEAMIAELEKSGNFEVILKDCSLGQKLPVVGVILVNKNDQSYFVKFGAHPKFEIAAERTLTELLQGQDIKWMMGVKEFCFRSPTDDPENYMGILVTGSGLYPTEFFSRNFSYQFKEFEETTIATNKEMLAYMVALLAQLGCEVYVRDVSFLGFPSFHVIVPGLSEIEEFDELKPITNYAAFNTFKRLVRNIDCLDDAGAATLIGYLQNMNYSPEASVMDLINLPVRNKAFPWYYSNADLFVTALNYWKGDTNKAYESFTKFWGYTQHANPQRQVITYYKCVRDFLATKIKGLAEKDAVSTLSVFYPMEVIQGVVAEFNSPAKIISYQGQLNCWNCENCLFSSQCLYPPMERVYEILKERYAASGIDQNDLKKLM
ncbi:YcaO-like family protein [Sporomusa aerivorans]|uniref:YcaO-like family protein n=1 Tax=Sporomusa aerivorans TaxID=204936 RepID=UPI00352AA1A7